MSADEQGCVGGLAGTSGVHAGERWFDETMARRRIERHGAVERLISIRLK
ncbi:MAG: hypothetical protein IPO97_09255 [Sphingomonadales bacterium]|nr:hypothetical protein [Sphingomonadales bacterium]